MKSHLKIHRSMLIFFYYVQKITKYNHPKMGKKGKYNQKNQQEENPKKKNFVITEQHLMDKTHMEQVEYFPYLPADSLYPPFIFSEQQQHLLRTILKQLNYVLYLDFKNFWATILYNPSFKICLHSCIQFFNRRWLNQYVNLTPEQAVSYELMPEHYSTLKDTPAFEYIQHLTRITLLILYRIMHFQQENAELSNLYHIRTEIVGKYILDVPRLIEIIEVYGSTNEDIVMIIVKQWTNLSTSLYGDFVSEIIEPMVAKIGKSLGMVKKTTDREQFGIEYNYKRNNSNELSAGEQQLKKKIKLLMQIISFYQTLKNIYDFFPSAWAEYTRFNLEIHIISENIFIQIEQAYKIWNTHNQSDKIYALMNRVLKYVIDYFVEFLRKCQSMFVEKNVKSNYKEAYMKCLDRMLEHYGRRQSLGKKISAAKRYMDLYRQILKVYKIDQFTSKLYVEEVENNTYGLNIEYLVDFKIAIDEQIAKLHGRPVVQPDDHFQQKTEADREEQREQPQIESNKQQPRQQQQSQINKPSKQVEQLDALQVMISKKHRQENYYQKLYKDYRTKITIEYEDQYDDLVDYEKRPMFEDNQKQEQDSSDASSQYDPEVQQLHLVKSDSNVERARGIGAQHKYHQKYDRKNKVKYVAMGQSEAQSIINRQSNKPTTTNFQKQKPTYLPKEQSQAKVEQKSKVTQKYPTDAKKNQYNDEECYQECRQKNKQEKQERQKKQEQARKQPQNTKNDYYDDEYDDEKEEQKRDGGQRGGYRGRGARGGHSNNYNNNKPKGTNTNKKKYEPKV